MPPELKTEEAMGSAKKGDKGSRATPEGSLVLWGYSGRGEEVGVGVRDRRTPHLLKVCHG